MAACANFKSIIKANSTFLQACHFIYKYGGIDNYTIADIAIWPWYGCVISNVVYGAAEFLEAHTYKHLNRWTEQIAQRPAVERGQMVNRSWGELSLQLRERHAASDFDLRTQDKLEIED